MSDRHMSLVTWLRAQLDEAERIAQAAVAAGPAPPWSVEDDQPYPNVDGSDGATVVDTQSGFAPPAQSVLVHIARHDPARALAEVDAKRRILDLHAIRVEPVEQSRFDPDTGQRREPEFNVYCEVCGWASFNPTSACVTVRLLALPYANRPGYDEAWRP